MAFGALLLLAVFCFAFFFAIRKIREHKALRDVVNKIPGPPALWILGNTHQFKLDKIAFTRQLEELAWRYGTKGMFRVWMGHIPVVLLTQAHTAEPVLVSNKLIQKSSQYTFLKTWLGDGLLISTGDKWRSRRKMLTPTFHFAILNRFVDVYNGQAKILVEQLDKMATDNITFNIFPYVGRCALDIICETAMGVKVNAQLNHRSDYVQSVTVLSEMIFKYERMPWLWIKPIFHLLGYAKQYHNALDVVQGFTKRVINQRKQEHQKAKETTTETDVKKKEAFLDLLLDMQEENKLTDEDIREEVDTFMFEGHDTTSSAMSFTLFLLGNHPEVQTKIHEEMDSIFENDDVCATAEDLKKMKYLDCVIKEGLRLFPSVPMFARRATETFESGGKVIPEGANVMIAPMMIHRDPSIYGEDALYFRPERFLNETSVDRNPFAYIPFSAGARNCIGQKFALMEEKTVLSTFLRHYIIKSLDAVDEIRPVPDLILKPPHGIRVRISHRRRP